MRAPVAGRRGVGGGLGAAMGMSVGCLSLPALRHERGAGAPSRENLAGWRVRARAGWRARARALGDGAASGWAPARVYCLGGEPVAEESVLLVAAGGTGLHMMCSVSSCEDGVLRCERLVPCDMGSPDEYRVHPTLPSAAIGLADVPGPGVAEALVMTEAFCVDRVDMDRVSNPHGEHASQVFTVAVPPGMALLPPE